MKTMVKVFGRTLALLVFAITLGSFAWVAHAQVGDLKTVSLDWGTILPLLVSAAAPMLTGFLQQMSEKFSKSAPWYAKWAVTAFFGAVISWLTSYATSGDALASAVGGVIVGTIGSLNIALRKGAGRFFDVSLEPPAK